MTHSKSPSIGSLLIGGFVGHARIGLIALLVFFIEGASAAWLIDSDGVGYVESHDGNTDSAMAEVVRTVSGEKQIIFRLKPLTYKSCEPQGVRNGEAGYLVKSKMFVNDTLIYTKKFIEPSEGGRCFIYYAGESGPDKEAILEAFLNGKKVIIEADGAEKYTATRYRGKQVVLTGASRMDGKAITFQSVLDSHGKTQSFVTVPSSEVRWAIFSTEGFRGIWDNY